MTLPNRKQQIEKVAEFIDADKNVGLPLEEVAAKIVDGYLEAITPPSPALHLRDGMLIKHVADGGKVRRVRLVGAWTWLVTENGGYGWLGTPSEMALQHCEEYRPKKRIEIDGKIKLVEMTDEQIAEAWDNPDWKVGDELSQHQREFRFTVVATGPACALLRNVRTGRFTADSNANLKTYYRREPKGGTEW